MKEQKYEIKFTEAAFSADEQRSNLQGRRKYTRAVAAAQKDAEALDSCDDFRKLVIDPALYEKDQSGYGIAFDRGVHRAGGGVILKHQQRAAESFLRDLRGFGLLADTVGSGKTFEAGVILSELAARGKVKSLMVVAPDQVYENWVSVLEGEFGLGKGVLFQVKKGEEIPTLEEVLHLTGVTRDGGFIRPAKPIIVDADVFAQWTYSPDLLIDVIVVDEAHHLCEDTGKYTGAMKLLSEMMQTKKRAEATYCLLLSATPHSGNLENMFRLWYFVRCKGGNPSDFEEKDDKERTAQYREEKKYYKDYICRGASNITEFIRRVKYLEVTERYSAEFDKYIKDCGVNLAGMSEYERTLEVDKFLKLPQNAKPESAVLTAVARAYHNGVLRSIMIRQPNRLSKAKNTVNAFFYPMQSELETVTVAGLNDEKLTIDFTSYSENGFPLVKTREGKEYLDEYLRNSGGNRPFSQCYADILNHLINEFKAKDKSGLFTKKGYEIYYSDRLAAMPQDIGAGCSFIPVRYTQDKLGYKYEYLKNLLRKHKGERVLVFFDYELSANERAEREVLAALSADKEFAPRIIAGLEGSDVAKTERDFNAKGDAVLVACDKKFTEGANLQACNIIVNYQVTPDPLAMDQRIGRIFRLGQKNAVTVYSLADMNRLEGFALAYFAAIGLLSSNSGDATILAGSNSDRMVALRCNECGRVTLMPQTAYEEAKRKRPQSLLCAAEERCRDASPDGRGTQMSEITVYDFKCDNCGTVLTRSVSDGYTCLSHVADGKKGRMCNSGVRGDRAVYCRKICAISHCKRFLSNPALAGKCPALERYKKNPNCSEAELWRLCGACGNTACLPQCKITGFGKEEIEACGECEYAGCSPKPYVLDFDEKWEADCPMPGCRGSRPRGRLRPVVARTFAAFITEAWKFTHDGGESFCRNLGAEAEKVSDVRRILETDAEE